MGERARPRAAGRQTRQRAEIFAELERAPTPLSAQELFARLRSQGSRTALATVYRNLQDLADQGVADRIVHGPGEAAFRLCQRGHHHHLTCRECGRVEEVRGCRLDAWADEVARERGFVDVEHAAELIGRCADCAARG